ncbi:translocon-associated protein subunit alpha-like [Phyllostomus discolor]|uniref:Translocon-associated protein subunit alpha-like n=1 Tax=Phyllostomus discolor TaxID=89673 RepID=A0A6J2LIC0_9CHIR|nr:translocon-associated protein subunit alpha-like [Phyllostomus discolor]
MQDLTENEETVEDLITEGKYDETKVEEAEPTDLAEDKEEEDVSGELESLPRVDTIIYTFIPTEPMGGQHFGLVIDVNYKDLNSNIIQDATINQTVTILKQRMERENVLNLENIFMYMFFACLQHLVAVGPHQLLESRKFWRPIQKIEISTSSQGDVDINWTSHETLNQINKASTRI